jgi:hypothetical protein
VTNPLRPRYSHFFDGFLEPCEVLTETVWDGVVLDIDRESDTFAARIRQWMRTDASGSYTLTETIDVPFSAVREGQQVRRGDRFTYVVQVVITPYTYALGKSVLARTIAVFPSRKATGEYSPLSFTSIPKESTFGVPVPTTWLDTFD